MTDDVAREARSVACADAPGRWAVAILFTRNTGMQTKEMLRLGTFLAQNEDDAVGTAIRVFREGDLDEGAASSIELALPISAARSQSEDTQAKPTPEQADVDALVEAAREGVAGLNLAMEKAPECFDDFRRPHRALRTALKRFQKG